jgi:hypothetical protein
LYRESFSNCLEDGFAIRTDTRFARFIDVRNGAALHDFDEELVGRFNDVRG